MKLINNSFLTTLAVAATFSLGVAGAAAAANIGSVPGVNGNVNVVVNNGVATVYGHVDSSFERNLTGKYVGSQAGVDRVINLITFQ